MLRKGTILKGRYEIQSLIGEGGMSRVYLAMDQTLTNKLWAVKEVARNATDAAGRPIEQSLASEADLLSKLDHPMIVDIADIEKTADFIYVIMDYVEGRTLEAVVREEGPQSEELVQKWMLQICDALGYLHEQNPSIVYRDMKPSNIMLRPDGYIKLIDLGVAIEYKDEARKDTIAFGTPGYAAPEQHGKAQTDGRTDIYGLGATMWHLFAGEAPPVEFPLPNVRTKNQSVGEGFADVIIPKCTQLERAARYQTCDELAGDLDIYDELTKEYRDKQKRKVISFAVSGGLALLFCIVGIIGLAMQDYTVRNNLGYRLDAASTSIQNNPAAAIEEYTAAIEYVEQNTWTPGVVDAYEGLINSYESKGSFSSGDREEFNRMYQADVGDLEKSERFSELNYEIGKLYWYYYTNSNEAAGNVAQGQASVRDDADNQAMRIKSSLEYFKVASEDAGFENSEMAGIYYGLADFTANITVALQTSEDGKEMYRGYWDNLVKLEDHITSDMNASLAVDSYALIANAMETYMDRFKVAGVSQSEVEALYKGLSSGIAGLGSTVLDSNTAQRKSMVEDRLKTIETRISSVYSNATVGGR